MKVKIIVALLLTLTAAVACAATDPADTTTDPTTTTTQAFESAAQAFAFAAAHDDTRAVLRTDDKPPKWMVVRDDGSERVVVLPRSTKLTAGDFFVYVDGYLGQSGTNCPTFDVRSGYRVGGRQVIGPQLPPIANTDGTPSDLAEKVNQILAAMRAHGLVSK